MVHAGQAVVVYFNKKDVENASAFSLTMKKLLFCKMESRRAKCSLKINVLCIME
jgi:hypothetical protein